MSNLFKYLLVICLLILSSRTIGQSVGVGTTSPSNYFHVSPPAGTIDPVRVELIQNDPTQTTLLSLRTSDGIVRYITISQYMDSAYGYLRDSLLTDTGFINSFVSVIINNENFIDSVFSTVRDSLLSDSLFLDSVFSYVRDSLTNDNVFLDSVFRYVRDSLLLDQSFIDSIYSQVRDSLLNDTSFLNELADSINTDDQNLSVGAGAANTSEINIDNGTGVILKAGTGTTLTESLDTIIIDAGVGAMNYAPSLNGLNFQTNFASGGLVTYSGDFRCSTPNTVTITDPDVPNSARLAQIQFYHQHGTEESSALRVFTTSGTLVGIVGQAGRGGDGRSFHSGGTLVVPIVNKQFRMSHCIRNGIGTTWSFTVVGYVE